MLLPGGPKIQMDSSLTHPTQGQKQDFTFLMLSHQVCFGVMCFFLRFCQPPMSDSNISINVLQIWHCKACQKRIRNNLTFRHPKLAQTYTCVNAKAGARSYLRRGGRGSPLPQPRARERVQPAFCRNKRPSTSGRWIQLADDAHNLPRGRPTARQIELELKEFCLGNTKQLARVRISAQRPTSITFGRGRPLTPLTPPPVHCSWAWPDSPPPSPQTRRRSRPWEEHGWYWPSQCPTLLFAARQGGCSACATAARRISGILWCSTLAAGTKSVGSQPTQSVQAATAAAGQSASADGC